jgi:hypothetical protein
MLRTAIAIGFFILLTSFGAAQAATISVLPTKDPDTFLVTVEGEFVRSDYEQFRRKTAGITKGVVGFQSPGGDVIAAIQMGRLIRLENFSTLVPDKMTCASACALAWLGGTDRFMGRKALIGFHAAYNADSGQETGVGNALVGAYLNEIGLPYKAVFYITSAAPTSMTWLTLADAQQEGINVSPLDSQATTAVSKSSPRLSQLRHRSKTFIASLYQMTSQPVDASTLRAFYADRVRYYGDEMSQDQVVFRIQKFIARWPIRKYEPIDRTISINCDIGSLICAADGNLLFDDASPARNERSSGRATFQYLLSFASGSTVPKIISENGTVSERNKASLNIAAPTILAKRIKDNVSLGYMNLRTGPGLNQAIITHVPAGTNGILVKGPCVSATDNESSYPFCPVEWNGYTGWISLSGLE